MLEIFSPSCCPVFSHDTLVTRCLNYLLCAWQLMQAIGNVKSVKSQEDHHHVRLSPSVHRFVTPYARHLARFGFA